MTVINFLLQIEASLIVAVPDGNVLAQLQPRAFGWNDVLHQPLRAVGVTDDRVELCEEGIRQRNRVEAIIQRFRVLGDCADQLPLSSFLRFRLLLVSGCLGPDGVLFVLLVVVLLVLRLLIVVQSRSFLLE